MIDHNSYKHSLKSFEIKAWQKKNKNNNNNNKKKMDLESLTSAILVIF